MTIFFVQILKNLCDGNMREFLRVCELIGMLVSPEKTFWGTTLLVFMGFLIDTLNRRILIPCEKIARGLNMISSILEICQTKKAASRKITVLQLQKICGFLNFLGRAILPGWAFTRRLYAHLENKNLLPHYHLRVTEEMRHDLLMWQEFLQDQSVYCQDFMDFSNTVIPEEIFFAMDASKNPNLGFGGHCETDWMVQSWDGLIEELNPSIKYIELFALVTGVLAWIDKFKNRKVVLYTDNKSVFFMINKTLGSCKNCMVLIRIMVMHCLKFNVRIFARHLKSRLNAAADSLSRFQFKCFK